MNTPAWFLASSLRNCSVAQGNANGCLLQSWLPPVHSRNPNVLRIEAVKALASCGDAESI
jgi:hypothetical protein